MNKLKKIGVSALAGSLVAFSASAADWSVSGSAGFEANSVDSRGATTWFQYDSVKISASGTTDNGINVSAMFELDGNSGGAASTKGATSTDRSSFDDQMVSFGTDQLGTLSFWGHGGSTALGAYDDVTPKAYEEVWDIGSSADTLKIDGGGENDMFYYTSPTISGVTLTASHVPTDNDSGTGHYTDFGVKFAPEMVEGLTVYYAQGTQETAATTENDLQTWAVTYAYGPVTVGYQESELDKSGVATDDESESMSIAYSVTEDLTISYGEREYDLDVSQDTNTTKTQKDSGFAVSYTMGGVSIVAQKNSHDNVAGAVAADYDSYALGVSFAF
jgi:outer membrane protein OmpU